VKTILKWRYVSTTEEVPSPGSSSGSRADDIDRIIPASVESNMKNLSKDKCEGIEVFQIITTPINDKILVTVVSRGKCESKDASPPLLKSARFRTP